jgi:hypothetical protein
MSTVAKRHKPQAHTGPTERKTDYQQPTWTIMDQGLDKKSRFLERRFKLDSARTVLLILLPPFWTEFEAYRERIADVLARAARLR